jgi:hypothetical protein
MSTEKNANAEFIERFLQLIGEKANGKPTIFARMAGIPPSTLFGYVNGRFPTHEHLLRIRDTFNVNINWLVSGEGDPYGSPPEGESAEPAYGYNLPEMPGGLDDARGVVNELLRMAKKVLLSGNRQAADALERNIRYFNHAVEIEGRLSGLEEKMGSLEERLKKKGILGRNRRKVKRPGGKDGLFGRTLEEKGHIGRIWARRGNLICVTFFHGRNFIDIY